MEGRKFDVNISLRGQQKKNRGKYRKVLSCNVMQKKPAISFYLI